MRHGVLRASVLCKLRYFSTRTGNPLENSSPSRRYLFVLRVFQKEFLQGGITYRAQYVCTEYILLNLFTSAQLKGGLNGGLFLPFPFDNPATNGYMCRIDGTEATVALWI